MNTGLNDEVGGKGDGISSNKKRDMAQGVLASISTVIQITYDDVDALREMELVVLPVIKSILQNEVVCKFLA